MTHYRLLLMLLGISISVSALPFNGSFELGTDGFALIRHLRTDTNPGLDFIPLKLYPGAPGHGKNSLKLENPYKENYNIFSKEFLLQADTVYHFEGKIRSAAAGEKVYLGIFKVDPQWSAESIVVNTGVGWKKFTKKFKTQKAGYYHLLIRPGRHDEAGSNTLWFDGLKITGSAAKSETVEAAAVPNSHLYTLGTEKEVGLILKVFNPTGKDYKETVTVRGIDEYSRKTLFLREIAVNLPPGKTMEYPFRTAPERFGAVRVVTTGKNLIAHDGFYSVIGLYEAKPVDITKDYTVSFNGGLYFRQYPQTKYPSYQCFNAPFGKHIELLSKSGCRILRDHDGGVRGVDWPAVEWEKGTFNFTHLDRQLELYAKNNITLFPVLGNCFIENDIRSRWQNQSLPPWAMPLAERVKNNPPNCRKPFHGRILLPPEDAFENYIHKTVKHINGRVPVYEITNEPNLYLSPEAYIKYLKIAERAIRSAQPDAQITGFCLTSDFNAAARPWMDQCIKLGGLQYVDAASFHPYGGRELGAIYPADKYIADLRKNLAPHRPLPLWNTELYYLIDHNAKHDTYEEILCQPHHVAWRFLVDLGEGAVQSIAIPGEYLWKRMLTPNMINSKNFQELIPSENFVAYNALARFFEGAKVLDKFRYPHGGICYVYKKDGRAVAAIWNYLKVKGLSADLSGFEVYDIFGNPLPPGRKELGDAPFYLKPGKLGDREFRARLKALAPRLEQPIFCAPVARRIGNLLLITLYNTTGKPQSGIVGLSGSPAAEKPVRFTLSPGGITAVRLPLITDKTRPDKAAIQIAANGRTISVPVTVINNRELVNAKEFQMKNARGSIHFDGEKIRLQMNVADADRPGTPENAKPWETDSVELFFDPAPEITPMRHPQNYTNGNFRLFITPYAKQQFSSLGPFADSKAELDVKHSSTGYSFDLTFPLRTGDYLGFDIKINNYSCGKKQEENTLSGKPELYRNRCNFTIVKKETK